MSSRFFHVLNKMWTQQTKATATATATSTDQLTATSTDYNSNTHNNHVLPLKIRQQLYEDLCKTQPSDDCVASNNNSSNSTGNSSICNTRVQQQQQRRKHHCCHTVVIAVASLPFAFNCCDYLGLLHTLVSVARVSCIS